MRGPHAEGPLIFFPARLITAKRFGAVLLLVFAVTGCGSPRTISPPEQRELSFLTKDGTRLVGTLYVPERKRPAGLLLVHSHGGSRSDFRSFAQQAQREGYMALAFDLRSFSSSGGPPDWSRNLIDIAGAREAVIGAGADAENLAIVGAGLGANLALAYAASDQGIQAAVLLSPEAGEDDITAVDAVKRYGRRPLMLMVSTNDMPRLSTCEALRENAAGHCEIREYDGTARGTAIFETSTTSRGQALLWLSDIIGPEAARRNRKLQAETGHVRAP